MRLDEAKLKIAPQQFTITLTHCLVAICVILFCWINLEKWKLAQAHGPIAASIGEVPVLQKLMFDYPPNLQAVQEFIQTHDLKKYDSFETLPPRALRDLEALERIPSWNGFSEQLMHWIKHEPTNLQGVTLFHDIRQGEIWRLVTPTFLHYNFLHILFNMAWLWMLGRQIEHRIGKGKLLLITLIVAVVTNVTQYLMTGPLFLGYSGVVVGMAGFIWMRQKNAPWEGYSLTKGTSLFLLIFVLAVLLLECVAFTLQALSITDASPNIANTAHVVGGLVGMGLAKWPFLARKAV